jgi:hypothetical protein
VKATVISGLIAIFGLAPAADAGSIYWKTPLTSGEVSRIANHQETGHDVLLPAQLQALAGWVQRHASGWSGMVTPPSNEPVELNLSLKQGDGSQTWLAVVADARGGHHLRLTAASHWVYESIGGLFKYWGATRPLTDEDRTELEKLIGPP